MRRNFKVDIGIPSPKSTRAKKSFQFNLDALSIAKEKSKENVQKYSEGKMLYEKEISIRRCPLVFETFARIYDFQDSLLSK